MSEMRKISEEQSLQAFALWVMAKHHNAEAERFAARMTALLGVDENGHLTDAIYGRDGTASRVEFDAALAKEGLTAGDAA